MVSGYLFRKVPENPFAIRAFEPLWGKRKVPAFVSKAGTYYGRSVIIGSQKTQIYQWFAGRQQEVIYSIFPMYSEL